MIAKDKVVSLNYTLTSPEGEVLDKSEDHPLEYLHGHHNIIPGLEKALETHKVGDKFKVEVKPEDGYGPLDESKRFAIDASHFAGSDLKEGMMVELTPNKGQPFMARIVGISEAHVDVDANHPMAGRHLCFDVEIVGIRDGLPEEIAHGHVHGPHGHHH